MAIALLMSGFSMIEPIWTNVVWATPISDTATFGSTNVAASTLSQEPTSGLCPI